MKSNLWSFLLVAMLGCWCCSVANCFDFFNQNVSDIEIDYQIARAECFGEPFHELCIAQAWKDRNDAIDQAADDFNCCAGDDCNP